jgi:hypothetical protein
MEETSYTLTDLLEGRKPKTTVDANGDVNTEYENNWDAADEGTLKMQKIIRKKIQSLDDPNEPYGYRKGKDNMLSHALKLKFGKADDKRKEKSPEHIQKMQAARGKNKTVKESMSEYLENL